MTVMKRFKKVAVPVPAEYSILNTLVPAVKPVNMIDPDPKN